MTNRWSRHMAFALLTIPIGFLLLFGILELAAGELGGIGHLVLAAPLIALAFVATRRPIVAGSILIGVGLFVAIAYLALVMDRDAPLALVALVEAILLVPVLVGIALVVSERPSGRRSA